MRPPTYHEAEANKKLTKISLPSWRQMAVVALFIGYVLFLGACTTGAIVTDKILTDAIFIKCKAASVGSVERRYMHGAWELWLNECLPEDTQ